MKKLVVVLMSMMTMLPLGAQDLERQWKAVERAVRDDQPRTVVMESRRLYEMAESRHNVPQMLRAYLTCMRYRDEIAPDSFRVDMQRLTEWHAREADAVDKAVLSLVLAVNTEDEDEALAHFSRALGMGDDATVQALAGRQTRQYLPLIQLEDDSEVFGHDMLSFLRQTAFDHAPVRVQERLCQAVYRRDEAYYLGRGDRRAAIRVALEGLDSGYSPHASIDQLLERYGEVDDLVVYKALQTDYYNKEKEALRKLRDVMARYPDHRMVNRLKSMADECIRPTLHLYQAPATVAAGEVLEWKVNSFNVETAVVSWYKLDNPLALWQKYLAATSKDWPEIKRKATRTGSQPLTIADEPLAHKETAVKLTAPGLPGYYLLEIKPTRCGEYPAEKAVPELQLVSVSDLLTLLVPVDRQQWEVWSLHRKSGTPVAGVGVQAFTKQRRNYTLVRQTSTGRSGHAPLTAEKPPYEVVLTQGNDITMPTPLHSYYHSEKVKAEPQLVVQLFTDRSLYRPGQTVEFSVLAFSQLQDQTQVAPGEEVEVQLLQPRESKPVATARVQTDQWGVASGKFQLPAEAKTGAYALAVPQKARCNIRVEEYKRPTFEVTWQPLEGEYALGDTVTVIGRATTYAGAPVAQAPVHLKTSYREMFWWRLAGQQELARDTVFTDDGGYFMCQVALVPPHETQNKRTMGLFNRFIVDATVTSTAGESHDAQQTVSVSANRFNLSLTLQTQECKERLTKWSAGLFNSAGQELKRPVRLSIRRANEKNAVWQDIVEAGKELEVEALKSLPSDNYVATVGYDTLTVDYPFSLFSLDDRRPTGDQPLWAFATGNEMTEGQPLTVQFGTSFTDAFLQINAYSAEKRVHHEEFRLSDELRLWKLPYQRAWGDAVNVVFTLVKDGKIHQEERSFQLAKPDKSLQAEWTSFRDQLQPGEKETWTLRITKNGKHVNANLMAALYDSSLDAISPHQWNFRLGFSRADVPFRPLFNQNFFYYEVQFPQRNNYPWKEWAFDRWAENIPIQVHRNFMFYGGGRVLQMSRAAMKADVADGIEEESKSVASNAMEDADQPATEIRSNFAETAFFYPMLRTDDKGEVRVEFTLPESLTRWRMIGLAHTGDMDFTLLSNHITARKLMMVQPQLPRFLRVGDEAVITATVQNLNGDALQGTVFVELTDSTFHQVAMKDSQPFAVEGNSSTVVSFHYKVKDLGPSVVCRIFAQADQFTDGEQRLLPVLSDKVWLTESRAFYLNDDKNQVDISGMMNGGKWWNEHSTMTVETIHNPLGFVVESLGELAQPRTGNAVDLASAYYAATLADWLGDTYPALAEQKAFAVNPSAGAGWLKRLQELQQPDGGFSWFKGMSSSPYITRMVVEPFVRLHALGAPVLGEARSATFLSKALAYLDKKAIESYRDMQQRERSGKNKITLGENELHYLYLNALLPHALTQDGKLAVEFFTQRLPLGLKGGSLYDKALACIVYQKMGKVSEARKCLQSLLEYTVYTEELGRYYDSNRSWVNWRNYRMPLQTLLVEALHLFSSEKLKVDPAKPALTATQVRRELCQWLLNQRRTQLWNTSPTVMDALYALLLAPQSELTVRHTDKLYSKTELTAKTASDMPGKWTLQRDAEPSDSPMSWVSISMTTHLPMDEVRADTPHSGLHIERNYYVESRKDGETRFELADLNQLCIGQKVTCRIKIRADRDFDFVEIHNQRAAAFELVRQLSGYEWHTGVGAYRSVTDDETCFFMDRLPKGEFEIAETFFVSQHGKYQTGLATAQGTYCPEFSDHTGSMTIGIPEKTK